MVEGRWPKLAAFLRPGQRRVPSRTFAHSDAELAEPAVRHAIVALHGPPSAQRFHPAGDGSPYLVRRIFLEEMEPRDRHLGLRWQRAGEVEIRAAGDEQTGLGLHEQLGY